MERVPPTMECTFFNQSGTVTVFTAQRDKLASLWMFHNSAVISMNYLCDSKAIIKLAVMPAGRLLVAFVNTSHFPLATAPVGFSFSWEPHGTAARWMSSWHPAVCLRLFRRGNRLKEFVSSRTKAVSLKPATFDRRLPYTTCEIFARAVKISCSVLVARWGLQSKDVWWPQLPSSPYMSASFFFSPPCEHTIRRTGRNLRSMLWWMSQPRSSFKISV